MARQCFNVHRLNIQFGKITSSRARELLNKELGERKNDYVEFDHT